MADTTDKIIEGIGGNPKDPQLRLMVLLYEGLLDKLENIDITLDNIKKHGINQERN